MFKTVSGARSSVHRGLRFRREGPVACVFEHGPTHGRVYFTCLILWPVSFLLAFHLIFLLFLGNKHLLQCVWVNQHDWLCLHLYQHFALWEWIKLCLILEIRTETHCCRCTESCFQVVNANVLNKSCYELMRLYCISVCICYWPHNLSPPAILTNS